MNKTIFISVFHPFVSRNILNTGVLDELLKKGNKVVLFVPKAKEEFYRRTYQGKKVEVESFDPNRHSSLKNKFFKNLAELLINTNTKHFHKLQALAVSKNYLKYFAEVAITTTLGRLNFVKAVFRFLERALNHEDAFGDFFLKYSPSVIFAPDIYGNGDVLLIRSAQQRKIKVVGMVLSWDNNTSKHLMRVMPEILLVQNEVIKEESVKIQAVPPEIIKVVGIPHYDYYLSYKPASREEFFNRIKGDSGKKLVLISPAGEKFIGTDWHIFEILKNAHSRGEIPENVQFLIRVHPTNKINWGGFVANEHFIIEEPGVSFAGVRARDNELDLKGVHHLLDTLTYSDVVINVLSSLVIDASILDKPVITVGFNGFETRTSFERSVDLYLREENMAKLLAVDATPVVRTAAELVSWVTRFLDHPSERSSERAELVRRQCWKLDGHSAGRIASCIEGDINRLNEK